MKEKRILEVLGKVDEKYVEEADHARHALKSRSWVKWVSIAACLCLVAAGVFGIFRRNVSSPGGGHVSTPGDKGGTEGIYSVAVYPSTENEKNVASADIASLTEMDALSHPLAAHLPKALPDGFHYGRGSLYHTVMKDGTEYDMLRVEYISGEIPEQQFSADGGAIAPDLGAMGDAFIVCVMNYEPNTDRVVYLSREEITLSLLEQNGKVDFRAGDCFVSVFSNTADPTTAFSALETIE